MPGRSRDQIRDFAIQETPAHSDVPAPPVFFIRVREPPGGSGVLSMKTGRTAAPPANWASRAPEHHSFR